MSSKDGSSSGLIHTAGRTLHLTAGGTNHQNATATASVSLPGNGTQNAEPEETSWEKDPLPLALARWHVGRLAHWLVGKGSESKRHRKFGQEVGELKTETGQGWGGNTRPRRTRRLAHRGRDLAEKQGSGCISGQLQGPALEQHLQAAAGPHGTAGPGWTPRAPLCGPLGPERADWSLAVGGEQDGVRLLCFFV